MVQLNELRATLVEDCWVAVALEPDLSAIHVDFITRKGDELNATAPPFNPNRLYRFIDAAAISEAAKQHAIRRVHEAMALYLGQVKAMQDPDDSIEITAPARVPSDQPFTLGWFIVVALLCGWFVLKIFMG